MFHDRHEAGHLLAQRLTQYKEQGNTSVLGLARGGVVIAFEIAKELSLPLHVIVPRKIGAPGNPELAIGAIMDESEGVFNDSIIRLLGISQNYIAQEIRKEKAIAQQRLAVYHPYSPPFDAKGQTVILADDGIATGATMLAAIKAMRQAHAQSIIVAVPVAATDSLQLIQEAADEVICLHDREDFIGVGLYYEDFRQVNDSEVIELLKTINQGIKNG